LIRNCSDGGLVKREMTELIQFVFVKLFGEIYFSCMLDFCPRAQYCKTFINHFLFDTL